MIPIHKKGKDKLKTSSYRPISLTSCVGKVMERMINTRLMWHLETNNLIAKEQAGFRQNRSTEDQAAYFAQKVEDGFQEKQDTLAVWIDMEKAFDKVWKDGLRLKLRKNGISGCMYRWLSQYLENRKARVQLNGCYSRKKTLREGVPQGGVLSPTLFLIYINDIMKDMHPRIQGAMYADDLVLWRAEESIYVAKNRIQQALDVLCEWTKRWMVRLNADKTTYSVFSLSPNQKEVVLQINGECLKHELSPTYLGITFDRRLTWKPHIEKAEKKAKTRLTVVRKLAGSKWGADMKTLNKAYVGNVRPALEYGMATWGNAAKSNLDRLTKVQNQATRIMTGAIKSTPIKDLESITGIQPLCDRRDMKMLVRDAKFKRLTDHPMNQRMGQPVCRRLKRNSFLHQTKELIKQNTDLHNHTPKEIPTCLSVPPWKSEALPNINMEIPGIEDKRLQSPEERRGITDAFLNIHYPCDSWTRVYTDGSAEDAVRNGGAGVCVKHSVDDEEHVSIPTGLHSTNYKAEAMALEEAATILERSERTKNNVVFLTDALSVLQSIKSNKDKEQHSLITKLTDLSKRYNTTLQWIPAHCGLRGNELADTLAKQGAHLEQNDSTTTYSEEKTIIKSCLKRKWKLEHPKYNKADAYNQLERHEQVVIFRLRTNHNKLKQHLYRTFKVGDTDQCPCGEEAQTAEHILQRCELYKELRVRTWPQPTLEAQKLYGCLTDLQRTAAFISETGLTI